MFIIEIMSTFRIFDNRIVPEPEPAYLMDDDKDKSIILNDIIIIDIMDQEFP